MRSMALQYSKGVRVEVWFEWKPYPYHSPKGGEKGKALHAILQPHRGECQQPLRRAGPILNRASPEDLPGTGVELLHKGAV